MRESLKMTQEELAKKADISRQTIASLENNMNFSTSTATIRKIAKALNCKPTDIFLF